MVYDPIRDCDIPSPSVSNPPLDPWRGTPGSVGASGGYVRGSDGYFDRRHRTQSPVGDGYASGGGGYRNGAYVGAQPPNFSGGQSSPTKANRPLPRTAVSSSSMSLRELLQDEEPQPPSRRGSTQSVYEEDRRGSRGASQRQSINSLLNDDGDVHSRPSMSPAPVQSPRNTAALLSHPHVYNISPGSGPYDQPAAYLSTNHGRHSTSRSPNPPSHPYPINTYVSPSNNASTLPSEYPVMGDHVRTPVSAALEPQTSSSSGSRRQDSSARSRPMLPPDTIPRQHSNEDVAPGSATRLTPQAGSLPLRSPSISVSPRSAAQPLPAAAAASSNYPLSRPTSSGQSYTYDSPSVAHRRLSEDTSRPTSSSGHNGRPTSRSGSAHQLSIPRRESQTSVSSSSHNEPAPRSPTPQKRPYDPDYRVTGTTTLFDPIMPDEVDRLKAEGRRKNPLYAWSARKMAGKPTSRAPSWSGTPTPGPSSTSANAAAGPSKSVERRDGASSKVYGGSDEHLNGHDRENGADTSNLSKSQIGSKRSNAEEEDAAVQRRRTDEQQHFIGNAAVASHYNARQEVGVDKREDSPIIGLKKFNNWIKSVLIGKFTDRPGRGRPGARVLDIGCGKGGDLNKWKQARIQLYVALDIADKSVEQARIRYQSMPRAPFEGHFFAHDCYSQTLSNVLPPSLDQPDYDNVTMQFCMHYAFESASKARMMMENVSRHLRIGGKFIGTIPDANVLLDKLATVPEDATELKFGNSCYFVEFEEREHTGAYGHAYRFYLEDAVEDVPEYLVHWDNLIELAQEYRLRPIYRHPFNEILAQEQDSQDFGGLLRKMGVLNERGESAMDADQWEAANIYMGFAFEKY